MRNLAVALMAAALFLGACRGAKVKPEKILSVTVEPAQVELGRRVTVTAKTVDQAELAYVSGTVGVTGLPVLPLRFDPATGSWNISRVLPAFFAIPPGSYEVKVWGQTREGEMYEGNTTVEVK